MKIDWCLTSLQYYCDILWLSVCNCGRSMSDGKEPATFSYKTNNPCQLGLEPSAPDMWGIQTHNIEVDRLVIHFFSYKTTLFATCAPKKILWAQ